MNKSVKDIYMYILGAIVLIGFFMSILLLALVEVPSPNEELLYVLIVMLAREAGTVIHYFYSTSKSSSDKTDIISNGNAPK